MSGSVIFWLLALLPGLIYPVLLYIYFLRFRERKDLIKVLMGRSVAQGSEMHRGERVRVQEEWQTRLRLNTPSYVYPTINAAMIAIAGMLVIFDRHFTEVANEFGLPDAVFRYTRTVPSTAATAGFIGAYVWGLYDFVDRFRI